MKWDFYRKRSFFFLLRGLKEIENMKQGANLKSGESIGFCKLFMLFLKVQEIENHFCYYYTFIEELSREHSREGKTLFFQHFTF